MNFYLKNALIVSILVSQTYYAEPKKLTDSEKVQYEKYYTEKESSKMKCNTLSGKLFFTIKMALTKSVAYESLYSIEI